MLVACASVCMVPMQSACLEAADTQGATPGLDSWLTMQSLLPQTHMHIHVYKHVVLI